MNDIERQGLKNQEVIMRALFRSLDDEKFDNINDDLRREWNNTIGLLNPPEEIPIADKTEPFFGNDALSQSSEVKK